MTYAGFAVLGWIAGAALAAPPSSEHICFKPDSWSGDTLTAALDAMKGAELADFTGAGFFKEPDTRGVPSWKIPGPPFAVFLKMATGGSANLGRVKAKVREACGRLRARLKPEVAAVENRFKKAFNAKLNDEVAALPPDYLKEKGKWERLIAGADLSEGEVNEIAGAWKAIDGYVEAYFLLFHQKRGDFSGPLKEYCAKPQPRHAGAQDCLGLAARWSEAAQRAEADRALAELSKMVTEDRRKNPQPAPQAEAKPAAKGREATPEAPILTPACRAHLRKTREDFQRRCESATEYFKALNRQYCDNAIALCP